MMVSFGARSRLIGVGLGVPWTLSGLSSRGGQE